jgi:hypothetical protein
MGVASQGIFWPGVRGCQIEMAKKTSQRLQRSKDRKEEILKDEF